MYVDIQADAEISKMAQRMDSVYPLLIKGMGRGLARGATEVTREARRLVSKGSESNLVGSIQREAVGVLYQRIFTGVGYGPYVEEGTGRGGWIPDKPLQAWIRAHGLKPKVKGDSPADMAQRIRLSILRHGIKARPFMRPAFERKEARVKTLVDQGVAKALEALPRG